MTNQIIETTTTLWGTTRKTKQTSSGWISGNAVCCHHNGESIDTRGRGGIIKNGDESISYSCFNCNFTANYTAGRPLAYKFRKLLSWLGAEESTIKRLVIEAIRVKEYIELTNPQIEINTGAYFDSALIPKQIFKKVLLISTKKKGKNEGGVSGSLL